MTAFGLGISPLFVEANSLLTPPAWTSVHCTHKDQTDINPPPNCCLDGKEADPQLYNVSVPRYSNCQVITEFQNIIPYTTPCVQY